MLRGVICVTVSISSMRPWQRDAADSPGQVRAVGEIGVVGKLVDANPAHRPAALGAVTNRCELLAVPLHELMAVHAGLGRRNVRDGGNLDRGVTVRGNRDQARRRGAYGCTGRAERDGSPRRCTTGKRSTRRRRSRAPDRDFPRWRPRSGVCSTTGENLGQWLGLRGAGGQLPGPRVRDGTVMPHPRPQRIRRRGTTGNPVD